MRDKKEYLTEHWEWLKEIKEDDVIMWVRAILNNKFDEIKVGAHNRMIAGDDRFGLKTFHKSRPDIERESEEELMDFINYVYMVIKK